MQVERELLTCCSPGRRALVVFRVITWAFAGFGVWTRWDGIVRPSGALLLLAVMGVWTVISSIGYSRRWGGGTPGSRSPTWS